MRAPLLLAAAWALDGQMRAVAVGPGGQILPGPEAGISHDDDWTAYATQAAPVPMSSAELGVQLRTAAASQLGAGGPERWPRILHILSMGRVGSSFFVKQLRDAGVPTAYEPFLGKIEGWATMHDYSEQDRLKCLYDVGPCTEELIAPKQAQELKDAKDEAQKAGVPLGIKTTRVHDFTAYTQLLAGHPELKDAVRYVLMLRDPRGVWSSTKPMVGWAIHDIGYVCAALRKELDTLPALQAAAGEDHVRVAVFEAWSAKLPAFMESLSTFYGFASEPEAWTGYTAKTESINEWEQTLTSDEIKQIEQNPDCKEYMGKVGYTPYDGNPTKYDQLKYDV